MEISFSRIAFGLRIHLETLRLYRAHYQSSLGHHHREFCQGMAAFSGEILSFIVGLGKSDEIDKIRREIDRFELKLFDLKYSECYVSINLVTYKKFHYIITDFIFIRDLIRQCFPAVQEGSVRCYELMCMHVGLVPVRLAARHIRKLATALFETSLGAHYPISLIQ
jgi:hypothetical protein